MGRKKNRANRLKRGFATTSVRSAPAPALPPADAAAPASPSVAPAPRGSRRKEKLEQRREEKERMRQLHETVELAAAAAVQRDTGEDKVGAAPIAPSASIAAVDVDAQCEQDCVEMLVRNGVVDRSAARAARRAQRTRLPRDRRFARAVVVYLELLRCGFAATRVKEAMRATGGMEGPAALDWLCLSTAAGALPKGWMRRITGACGAQPSFEVAEVKLRADDAGVPEAAAPEPAAESPLLRVKPAPAPASSATRSSDDAHEDASWRAAILALADAQEDASESDEDAAAKADEARRLQRWDALSTAEQLQELRDEFDQLRTDAKANKRNWSTAKKTRNGERIRAVRGELARLNRIAQSEKKKKAKKQKKQKKEVPPKPAAPAVVATEAAGNDAPSAIIVATEGSVDTAPAADDGADVLNADVLNVDADADADEEFEEEGLFSIFDAPTATAGTTEARAPTPTTPSIFTDESRIAAALRGWTGASPVQVLQARTKKGRVAPPKYIRARGTGHNVHVWTVHVPFMQAVASRASDAAARRLIQDGNSAHEHAIVNHWRFTMHPLSGDSEADETTTAKWCATQAEAQNVCACVALFELFPGQPLHNGLPPPLRDLWVGWLTAAATRFSAAASGAAAEHEQFVRELLDEHDAARKVSSARERTQTPARASEAATGAAAPRAFSGKLSKRASTASNAKVSERLQNEFEKHSVKSAAFQSMQAGRSALPIFDQRANILEALEQYDALVVSGETGSGKTTQVPSYILEEAICDGWGADCRIVCTQPRRISAVSIARRVREELGLGQSGGGDRKRRGQQQRGRGGRGGTLPAEIRELVGHHIRGERTATAATRLTFCTTGVLLRQLQSDAQLAHLTHIIVDEVHERSMQSDFLLVALRRLAVTRRSEYNAWRRLPSVKKGGGPPPPPPPLKVILMSATVDEERLASYFRECAIVSASGRTFPVRVHYLEDVVEATGYACELDSQYTRRDVRAKQRNAARAQTVHVTGAGGHSHQTTVEWDDMRVKGESDVSGEGAHLDPALYSPNTRRTVGRLDLHRANNDLIVELLHALLPPSDSHRTMSQAALVEPPVGAEEGGEDGEASDAQAVLIFMAGLAPIQRLHDVLAAHRHFGDRSRFRIVALHSALVGSSDGSAFAIPPPGVRKIVISTNIAETGITIPDVAFVIDTGRVKQTGFDERANMRRLEECWVSRASAMQRQGRAGRVRPGQCYRLFPRRLFEVSMEAHTLPELLRVPLEEPCLQIMASGAQGAPTTFLAEALDPPSHSAVVSAMMRLKEVGALDLEDDILDRSALVDGDDSDWVWCSAKMRVRLRPLGRQLAQLPVDVKIGRMLVFGAIFGCIDPVATIAASMSLSQRSPFVAPMGRRAQADAARRSFCERSGGSDVLAIARAYAEWCLEEKRGGRKASKKFCDRFFLSHERMRNISRTKRDLLKLLSSIGFVPRGATKRQGGEGARSGARGDPAALWALDSPRESNKNAAHPEVVKAALVAGLWPQAARCYWATDQRKNVPKMLVCGSTKKAQYHLHPSSSAAHWLRAARTTSAGGGGGGAATAAPPHSSALPSWGRGAAEGSSRDQWVVYLEKMRTTKVYLHDVTPVSPASIMLFGGAIGVVHASHRVTVDEWVEFRSYPRTAVVFRRLREALDELLLRKIRDPTFDFAASPVAKAAVSLLTNS